MTGTIRINGQSISVPTYIVKATEDNGTQENRDRNFETKVFLDQVREATKKPDMNAIVEELARLAKEQQDKYPESNWKDTFNSMWKGGN